MICCATAEAIIETNNENNKDSMQTHQEFYVDEHRESEIHYKMQDYKMYQRQSHLVAHFLSCVLVKPNPNFRGVYMVCLSRKGIRLNLITRKLAQIHMLPSKPAKLQEVTRPYRRLVAWSLEPKPSGTPFLFFD